MMVRVGADGDKTERMGEGRSSQTVFPCVACFFKYSYLMFVDSET